MVQGFVTGIPGASNKIQTDFRVVSRGGKQLTYLARGVLIDGTKASDIGNGTDVTVLRPGTLMGIITTSRLYANSVIDTLGVASTASATSLTISAPGAVEVVRRIGPTGTFILRGPPTANGTIANETVTYSAVNVTTGVITCSAVTNAYVLGSLIQPTDGSQNILSFIPDGCGILVTDASNVRTTVQWPNVPIEGPITSTQLLPWPTDTSIQAYIAAALSNAAGGPQFEMSHLYI